MRISESAALPVLTAGWFIPMTLGAALGPILLLGGVAGSGAGDVIVFGTCSSTTISATQTPAQVAASGLVANLD